MADDSITSNSSINLNTEMSVLNVQSNSSENTKTNFQRLVIEAFKQKNSQRMSSNLLLALEEIKNQINNNNTQSSENNFMLNKNIIDKLSRITERKFFNVNIIVAKLFDTLLEEENFRFLSMESELLINFANEVLNLLEYIKFTIISKQLEKKCEKFLNYLLNLSDMSDEQRNSIRELIIVLPTKDVSETYRTYDQYKEKLYQESIKKNPNDKMEALNKIIDLFGSLASIEEQFDLFLEKVSDLFKAILLEPKEENKEVYFQIGNFICSLLYATKFKLDAYLPDYFVNLEELNLNSYFIFSGNELIDEITKSEISFLHNTVYELTTQKEILLRCDSLYNKICKPLIKSISAFTSIFDLQYVNYVLLKRLYFTFPHLRQEIEDSLVNTLVNMCMYTDPFEKENSEECRVFIHYLMKNGDEELKKKLNAVIEEKKVNIDLVEELSDAELNENEYEYLKLADFNLRIGFPNRQVIEAGSEMSRYIEVYHPNSLVYIGFATQDHDINLHVLKYFPTDSENETVDNTNQDLDIINTITTNATIKEDEDYSDKGHFKLLLKVDKLDCSTNPSKIVIFVPHPGTYKIIFDNTYSWFTSKTLKYRISVLKPLSHLDLENRIDFSKLRKQMREKKNDEIDKSPHKNKLLMLKFEGQNRAFKVGRIFHDEKLIKENPQYLTIPVILTKNSIRIFRRVTDEHGLETEDVKEINLGKENESNSLIGENLPLNRVFEDELTKYLESIPGLEGKSVFLDLFIMDKKLEFSKGDTGDSNLQSQDEVISVNTDSYYNYILNKIGFYPEKLFENFANLRLFCCSMADSCLLYLLYDKILKNETFENVIHIHFDKYKSQVALYFEGVIHEKFTGYHYDIGKSLIDNIDNIIEFVKKVTSIFGAFDLSVSFTNIEKKEFVEFADNLKSKLENIPTEDEQRLKVRLETQDETFIWNMFNAIELFHMAD